MHVEASSHGCYLSCPLTGIMAACVLLSMAVCLLLTQTTSAKNDAPCQPSKWNNGYSTFLRRHLPSGTPNTEDRAEWKKYIQSLGGCDRPTQSFLHPEDLEEVRSVCSSRGKVLKDNLCISQQRFTFFTVRSELGTCGIKSIKKESKHLILACEVLENQCVPVHFEGNPEDLKPNNNARSCQDPGDKNQAVSTRMSWLWVFVCLFFIYAV
uniref:Ribonuclease A-domain domain-containing protein n=2 Tax=Nothobranchius korthausae TaxID=1143690 RepID=A0A1A8F8J8_9TELE